MSSGELHIEVGWYANIVRVPLQAPKVLELAASATADIAIFIFQACQYLRPQWLDYNFAFGGPKRLIETADIPIDIDEEDYGCFDRTLVAYCMAYNVRSQICMQPDCY